MKLFHSNLSSPQLARIKLPTSITELGGEDTDQGTSRTLTQNKKSLKEDNKKEKTNKKKRTSSATLFPTSHLLFHSHPPRNHSTSLDTIGVPGARKGQRAKQFVKVPEVRPALQIIPARRRREAVLHTSLPHPCCPTPHPPHYNHSTSLALSEHLVRGKGRGSGSS